MMSICSGVIESYDTETLAPSSAPTTGDMLQPWKGWLRRSLCHRTTSKGNTRRLAFVSTRATLLSRNSAQVHSPPASLHHGLEDLSVAPALSDAQRRTIYALSTPPGKGGIAVIRVSGPDAARVYTEIIRSARPHLLGLHSIARSWIQRAERRWTTESYSSSRLPNHSRPKTPLSSKSTRGAQSSHPSLQRSRNCRFVAPQILGSSPSVPLKGVGWT